MKSQRTPLQDLEKRERDMAAMREDFKKDQLKRFLEGPDPRTLPVNSIGTCPFCEYHGAGPGHDCRVWDAHHKKGKKS
jgi:hypothetical protein